MGFELPPPSPAAPGHAAAAPGAGAVTAAGATKGSQPAAVPVAPPPAVPNYADFDPAGAFDTVKVRPQPLRATLIGLPPAGSDADKVYQVMAADEQDQFRALGRDRQEAFLHLGRSLDMDAEMSLYQALRTGALTLQDGQGASTLDHLMRLHQDPLQWPASVVGAKDRPAAERDFRSKLIGSAVNALIAPRSINQGGHGTCGATVVQRAFARQRPADYVRFAVDLAVTGKGHLPDGRPIELERTALAAPASFERRPPLDRLVQASLMNAARRDHYQDPADRRDVRRVLGLFEGSGAKGVPGLDEVPFVEALSGQDLDYVTLDHINWLSSGGGLIDGIRPELMLPTLQQELHRLHDGKHREQGVLSSLKWGNEAHWVEAMGIQDGRVILENPHGNMFDARMLAKEPVHTDRQGRQYIDYTYPDGGPAVRLYADGRQSMSVADFEARVFGLVVAQDVAATARHRPENRFDPGF